MASKTMLLVLLIVLLCTHSLLVTQLQAQSKTIKHIVLIGFDGLGAHSFDSADIKN